MSTYHCVGFEDTVRGHKREVVKALFLPVQGASQHYIAILCVNGERVIVISIWKTSKNNGKTITQTIEENNVFIGKQ